MTLPFVKSSFNTILKLHEVVQFGKLVTTFADTSTDIPGVEEQARFHYGAAQPAVFGGGR